MYGVEHYYAEDDASTYEIFETLEQAEEFCINDKNWNKNHFPLFIFKADFNTNCIYKEEDGEWNYEDYADTIIRYHSFIKVINEKTST